MSEQNLTGQNMERMQMSMNETPASERIHIGIFGRRNAGKSSIINGITGQDLAIVSAIWESWERNGLQRHIRY